MPAQLPCLFRRENGPRFLGARSRAARGPRGIILTILRPGFIRTPLTAKNPYAMPGLMDAARAAKIIATGIARKQRSITLPPWLTPSAGSAI